MIDLTIAAAARLQAQASGFAVIGTAADFEAVANLPRSVPAAYVLPLAEQADPSELIGRSAQKHLCSLGVLLIVRHAGDASGGAAASRLQTLREAVQAALVGWQPAADCGSIGFASGELVDFRDGATVWQDTFTTERWVQRNT